MSRCSRFERTFEEGSRIRKYRLLVGTSGRMMLTASSANAKF